MQKESRSQLNKRIQRGWRMRPAAKGQYVRERPGMYVVRHKNGLRLLDPPTYRWCVSRVGEERLKV